MKIIKIYCDDLEKTIDKDGCYNAKGSMICRVCLEKPLPKKHSISLIKITKQVNRQITVIIMTDFVVNRLQHCID